jgi:hypothetical protein
MHGMTVIQMASKKHKLEIITVTPDMAAKLLELNNLNRPLSQAHVARISRQITDGKWVFNGDTIKIAENEDVLDGQHRLWAVVESQTAIETIIVYGVVREAFATIDTLRKPRSGSDTLAINGMMRYRQHASSALQWMIRYQRKVLTEYKSPGNKVENSDIEEAFKNHPQIAQAVERSAQLRSLANPGIMGFFYYILMNQNSELADTMMKTLEDPTGTAVSDPFYQLRAYFTADHHRAKNPVTTIALCIKAANASYQNQKIQRLNWRNIGKAAEEFPVLNVSSMARAPKKKVS